MSWWCEDCGQKFVSQDYHPRSACDALDWDAYREARSGDLDSRADCDWVGPRDPDSDDERGWWR